MYEGIAWGAALSAQQLTASLLNSRDLHVGPSDDGIRRCSADIYVAAIPKWHGAAGAALV